MINRQYTLLLTIIFLFSSSLSYGAALDKSIDQLLDLSGLNEQIQQLPGVIKAGLEQSKQQGTPIPNEAYNDILNSVDSEILPSKIIADIRHSLKQSLSEQDAKQLLVWYRSDLGKEITQAEKRASTPEAQTQMMQSLQTLLADTERVEFAQRIDTLLGASDMAVSLQEHTSIAVYSAVLTAMQPNAPLNIDPIKAQLQATREQTRTAMQQFVTASFVHSYKEIGTSKLNRYEEFLRNDVTMTFNQAIFRSMNNSFETAVSAWAAALAEIFQRH